MTGGGQFGRDAEGVGFQDIQDRDRSPFLGHTDGGGAAEPECGSGHNGDLVLETVHGGVLRIFEP